MPVLKESSIERRACQFIRLQYGIPNIKLHANGWPDRQFFIPGGRPVFIEFKRPGEKLSPLQQYIHSVLRSLNYEVYVCDTVAGAVAIIAEAVEAARKAVAHNCRRREEKNLN